MCLLLTLLQNSGVNPTFAERLPAWRRREDLGTPTHSRAPGAQSAGVSVIKEIPQPNVMPWVVLFFTYLNSAAVINKATSASIAHDIYISKHGRRTRARTLNTMEANSNNYTPNYVKTCAALFAPRGLFLLIGTVISASIESDGGASTLLHFVALLIFVAEAVALVRFSAHMSSPSPAPDARAGRIWAIAHFALSLASLGVLLICLRVGWSEDKWKNERFIYLPDMFAVTLTLGALAAAPIVHVGYWRWCDLRRVGPGRRGDGFAVVDDEVITLVPCASDDGDGESAPLAVAEDAAAGTCADGYDGSVGKASFESAA